MDNKKLADIDFHAEVVFKTLILETINAGMQLDIGAVTLSVDGRNCILDAKNTNYKNRKHAGKNIQFESNMFIDYEAFEKGDEYNYDLLVSDLKRDDLKVEFFCGDEYLNKGKIDMKNAKINVVIRFEDGKEYILEGKLES